MPRVLLLLLAVALVAGCDSSDERPPRVIPPPTEFVLVYRVEPTETMGAPTVDAIRYVGANGEEGTLRNVSLPWSISLRAPVGVDRVYSLESEVTVGGDVTGMIATILVDGDPKSQGVVAGESGGFNRTRTARASWRYRP